MMMIWSTSGVPRTSHTSRRHSRLTGRKADRAFAAGPASRSFRFRYHWTGRLKGAQRLMEPKEMTSPRGSAPMSVTKNSSSVLRKPLFRAETTV